LVISIIILIVLVGIIGGFWGVVASGAERRSVPKLVGGWMIYSLLIYIIYYSLGIAV